MIGNLLRNLFQPHDKTPPPPVVRVTSDDEKQLLARRHQEITARLIRLQFLAEQAALRHREGNRHER